MFASWSDDSLWDYVNYALVEDGPELTLAFPREWEAQIYATPPQAVWDAMPQITQPTLGIRAAQTDTIFPEAWQLWQKLQPQATFLQIENAGHMLTMERPLPVAEAILTWLKQSGV